MDSHHRWMNEIIKSDLSKKNIGRIQNYVIIWPCDYFSNESNWTYLRFSKLDESVVFYYQNRSPKSVHTFRLHMLGDGFRRICYNNIDENVLGRSSITLGFTTEVVQMIRRDTKRIRKELSKATDTKKIAQKDKEPKKGILKNKKGKNKI